MNVWLVCRSNVQGEGLWIGLCFLLPGLFAEGLGEDHVLSL